MLVMMVYIVVNRVSPYESQYHTTVGVLREDWVSFLYRDLASSASWIHHGAMIYTLVYLIIEVANPQQGNVLHSSNEVRRTSKVCLHRRRSHLSCVRCITASIETEQPMHAERQFTTIANLLLAKYLAS